MKRTFVIALLVVLSALVLITACAPAPAGQPGASATSVPTRTPRWPTLTPVPPTPTPRVVRTNWVLTHANYGRPSVGLGSESMDCPMPNNMALISTEEPEIKFDSGTVQVKIKGENSYWVENWNLVFLERDHKDTKLSPLPARSKFEKTGTTYIQPADCTIKYYPADFSLEIE